MYRILFFLVTVIMPIIFGWWIFVPLALLFVYLAKLPYELVLAGFILDLVYYFGSSFWQKYPLTIFSVVLIIIAFFLSKRIHWPKVI